MNFKAFIPPLAAALAFLAPGLHAQETNAARFAAQVCASCHGQDGNSISPAFPRLAGQKAAYIEAQLKAFRDRTRGDPMAQAYMWGMASQLSDDMITKLAAYYASRKPVKGSGADSKQIENGRRIFMDGIPAERVQACASCHGANAAGAGIFPRLAGQHAEYLVKQLSVFKSELRTDKNATLMHTVSSDMSFEQMQAVAAYLASR